MDGYQGLQGMIVNDGRKSVRVEYLLTFSDTHLDDQGIVLRCLSVECVCASRRAVKEVAIYLRSVSVERV